MKKRTVCLWIIMAIGAGAPGAEAQGPPGGKMPPPEVALAPVDVKTVPVTYEFVGLTQASKTVEARARVQGFLETRDFQEGAYLNEGDRLFTIDARSFKADKEIAAAQVEQAEARVKLAEQEVKRLQSVRQPGAITQSDLDQKVAEQSTASAALRLARAQLAKADLELSYTTVTAPLTGFVAKAQKEIGSLVDSGQNSLLTVMQQVDPLYVSFQVTESDYLTWKREEKNGQLVLPAELKTPQVQITLADGTEFEAVGVLDFENVNLSQKTGSVELRATFKNEGKVLKPGQFVKVHLQGWQRPNALTVPQRAVSESPEGPYVYVVGADSKAERRLVKLGTWAGTDWIIMDGVKQGEQVIVEGLTKVRPGVVVNSAGAQSPPADPSAPGAPAAASPAAAAGEERP